MSENFASLCNLLLENFQGMRADKVFDISVINSRMKEGKYESAPVLFFSDIQQVNLEMHARFFNAILLQISYLVYFKLLLLYEMQI